MVNARYITITVHYDGEPRYGRSLQWIAPELGNSALAMTEDHIAGPQPSRTWAGLVDGPTFERFAKAWQLPVEIGSTKSAATDDLDRVAPTYTLDGMNWEVGGISPIVCVSIQVTPRMPARSEADSELELTPAAPGPRSVRRTRRLPRTFPDSSSRRSRDDSVDARPRRYSRSSRRGNSRPIREP